MSFGKILRKKITEYYTYHRIIILTREPLFVRKIALMPVDFRELFGEFV